MTPILIADSGGTSTDWLMLRGDDRHAFSTPGLNPNHKPKAALLEILTQLVQPQLSQWRPPRLWFYGAGLAHPQRRADMTDLLVDNLTLSEPPRVHTDLEGAAIACFGESAGVVGILGTGSAAIRCDRGQVRERRGGLGPLLGDEGGGVALGRHLLRQLLNEGLPHDLAEACLAELGMTRAELIHFLAQTAIPYGFFAERAPFLARHRHHPEIQAILEHQFRFFLEHDLAPLRSDEIQVILMGGVAQTFAEELHLIDKGLNIFKQTPVCAIAENLRRITALGDYCEPP